jgi:aminoglycoside phosphotransferase (APT) family kinase protein
MPGSAEWTAWTQSAVIAEAAVLEALATSDVPAPRFVACTDGSDLDGQPAIVMSRAPGRLNLRPADPHDWVRRMAVTLARIHAAAIAAPEWESWIDANALSAPAWTHPPDVWKAAIEAARTADATRGDRGFIHRDYQHFNILWRRERITAVVDWVMASTGPLDIDVGHCRLNLAVLFSADLAERFRRVYEGEAGRKVEAQWDITSLLSFSDRWHSGIPKQIAGRTTVDQAGMNDRVEDVLAAVVARL